LQLQVPLQLVASPVQMTKKLQVHSDGARQLAHRFSQAYQMSFLDTTLALPDEAREIVSNTLSALASNEKPKLGRP